MMLPKDYLLPKYPRIIDAVLWVVNLLQKWLEEVDRRLVNRRYPIGAKWSEISRAFVKAYEADIHKAFESESMRQRYNSLDRRESKGPPIQKRAVGAGYPGSK